LLNRGHYNRAAIPESSDEEDEDDEEKASPLQAKRGKVRSPKAQKSALFTQGKGQMMGRKAAQILEEMACTKSGVVRVERGPLKKEITERMRACPGNFGVNQAVLEQFSDKSIMLRLEYVINKHVDDVFKEKYLLTKKQKETDIKKARKPLLNLIQQTIKEAQRRGGYPGLKATCEELQKQKNPILMERMKAEHVSTAKKLSKILEQYVLEAEWYQVIREEYNKKHKQLEEIYESVYAALAREHPDMRQVSSTTYVEKLESTPAFVDFTTANPHFKSTSEKRMHWWYENKRGVKPLTEQHEFKQKLVAEIKKLKESNKKMTAAEIVVAINEKFGTKKTKTAIEKMIFKNNLSKKQTSSRASKELVTAVAGVIEQLKDKNNGKIPPIGRLKKIVHGEILSMEAFKSEWLRLTNGDDKRAKSIIRSSQRKLSNKSKSPTA
jgi:hypothetical protein